MTAKAPPPWKVPVAVHDLPESGRQFHLVADADVRAGLAQALGLNSLLRLEANFALARHGRDGVRVSGQVLGTVGQTCIVTLEPIENEIAETVDLVFAPEAPARDGRSQATDDGPEPLIGGTIDLGAIAAEFLTLGIDPYPRKPGAVFEAAAVEDDSDRPFAALAALKKRRQDP